MPATYTHHIFTKDVYKNLDVKVQNKLSNEKEVFYLFGKSFDALLFGNIKLGGYAHNHNVSLYFKNIIQYIMENKLENNEQVLAYLYGSICHYMLDSIVHPYIYYKTGKYDNKNKMTYKYKGKHDALEFMIDAIIYNDRENKPIYKSNVGKEVFHKLDFSDDLKKVVDYAFKNTFSVDNGFKIYNRCYWNYRFIYKHILVSRFGIKAFFYRIIDASRLVKTGKIRDFCYYIKKLNYSVLNLEHKKWCYPVDKKLTYHYSFYDLYDVAIEKTKNIINELSKVLNKDEKEINKVLKMIGNNSYTTGKNCNKNYQMKYFEF